MQTMQCSTAKVVLDRSSRQSQCCSRQSSVGSTAQEADWCRSWQRKTLTAACSNLHLCRRNSMSAHLRNSRRHSTCFLFPCLFFRSTASNLEIGYHNIGVVCKEGTKVRLARLKQSEQCSLFSIQTGKKERKTQVPCSHHHHCPDNILGRHSMTVSYCRHTLP